MKKKELTIVGIMLILLLLLTGCGNNKKSKEVKSEEYADGVLEYKFDDSNGTATVEGIKSSISYDEKEKITEIVIPNNVVKDGKSYKVTTMKSKYSAYYTSIFAANLNIKSVTVPKDFVLPKGAFARCPLLEEVFINEGTKEIPDDAFWACENLSSVVIPDSVSIIGKGAFSGCKNLQEIVLPKGLTKMGNQVFSDCTNLKSITIPDSVTEIGYEIFTECKNLETAKLPKGMTKISSSLFSGCENLKSVNIPESVKEIGGTAFSGCKSLTNISLSENLEIIGNNVFSNCKGLKKLVIPSKVSKIGSQAFFGCDNIELSIKGKREAPTGWDKTWNYLSSIADGTGEKVKVTWEQ